MICDLHFIPNPNDDIVVIYLFAYIVLLTFPLYLITRLKSCKIFTYLKMKIVHHPGHWMARPLLSPSIPLLLSQRIIHTRPQFWPQVTAEVRFDILRQNSLGVRNILYLIKLFDSGPSSALKSILNILVLVSNLASKCHPLAKFREATSEVFFTTDKNGSWQHNVDLIG